jgi:hypothetical protein
MSASLGAAHLVLGAVYTTYGLLTLLDMKRGWRQFGFSHFGAAWVAMAFTCGPHHLAHGFHLGFEGRSASGLDLLTVLVGLPFGVLWLLLRIEAFTGGRGDRHITGTPWWLRAAPTLSAVYLTALVAAAWQVRAPGGFVLPPSVLPNVLLVAAYFTIGYFLFRTQLRNRSELAGWSVSGLSLGFVFPTCALMHGVFILEAAAGRYHADPHGLVVDWLGVPAGLYAVAPSVTEMSSPDAAELAKLFENVFRNVNIALANELALICERLGLDVWEVIRGSSTKPFGFMPFYPGPGVGGHCIPVDPYYLAARAREVGFHERFIETAGDINSRMPEHVVSLVAGALNTRGRALRGSRVLVIGVAFKPDVSDDRNTPARPIVAGLLDAGAEVSYHDPRLPAFDPSEEHEAGRRPELRSLELADALAARPDCVVIVTPHHDVDWDRVFAETDLVVDTRDASHGREVRPGQVLRLGAGWS